MRRIATSGFRKIRGSPLLRRLFVFISVFFMLFSVIVTALNIFYEYNKRMEIISKNFEFIENSYIPSIENSLYEVNYSQVRFELKGITKLRFINSASIIGRINDQSLNLSAGNGVVKKFIKKEYDISYKHSSGLSIPLGKLRIISNLDMVYSELFNIVIINSIMIFTTFLILAFIFIIFIEKMVIRHLVHIKDFISSKDSRDLRKELFLSKKPDSRRDELDMVADSINKMRKKISRDIQERAKSNIEIEKLRDYLDNIINSMPSTLICIDQDKKIIILNTQAERLSNTEKSKIPGSNLYETFHEMQDLDESISTSMITGQIETIENIVWKNNSNEKQHYHAKIFPLNSGIMTGTVILIENVTEYLKKEGQLIQAQKMESIGTLAGGLAHDFNNVLGGIIGVLSIIELSIEKGKVLTIDELSRYIGMMNESSLRAKDLVQHLLTLSRKHEINPRTIDINTSIENVIKICRNTFDKKIVIVNQPTTEKSIACADPTLIEQVILNICINSSHSMTIMRKNEEDYGGELIISIQSQKIDKHFMDLYPDAEKKDYWMIKIQDTGIGMDPETVTHIFEPFFTTKEKESGTGLGLSMVYSIIKQHSGFIDVYSVPNMGTSFTIFIPQSEKNQKELHLQIEEDKLLYGKGIILVVDDESILRITAKAILEECGYEVILANDGIDCINKFKENIDKIDLVLLDLVMPGKTGREAFIEMHAMDKDVKVILASGFLQDQRIETIINLGVKEFIQKPYSAHSLSKAVYNAIYGDSAK